MQVGRRLRCLRDLSQNCACLHQGRRVPARATGSEVGELIAEILGFGGIHADRFYRLRSAASRARPASPITTTANSCVVKRRSPCEPIMSPAMMAGSPIAMYETMKITDSTA